jgi:hypothetical protein
MFAHLLAVAESTVTGISKEGWITIMLAGITVLVTLLGIIIAVAAFFGYGALSDIVKKEARKAGKEAARQVSLEEVTKRAKIEAGQVARRTVLENKDKWLTELSLGVELAEAQSEPETAAEASDKTQAVSPAYPGEGAENDGTTPNTDDDTGSNNL